MLAVQRGQEEMADALLEAGAHSSFRSEGGLTPVMLAARQGNAELIRILVHWKADVNLPDHMGSRALTQGGHNGVIEVLVQAGADIDACPRVAVRQENAALVRTLLHAGADSHAAAGGGGTAMGGEAPDWLQFVASPLDL